MVAVKTGISPLPLEPMPIDVFEFVHKKVPPIGVLAKLVVGITVLLHETIFVGTVTTGVGFTVIE